MEVTFFHRKPIKGKHWSLEFIFNELRLNLSNEIDSKIKISRFTSQGFLKRIYNILEAPFYQSNINHITGDIHYVSFFLKKKITILTILDCSFMNTENNLKKIFFKLFWLTLPEKKVTIITTISEFSKKQIIEYLPKVNSEKIHVIPVSVSNNFKYQPRKFNKLKPIILQIGTAPNKNLLRLLDAINDINCEIIIVGELNSLQISKLKEKKFFFTNYTSLTENEIINLYNNCDIVSFVSTFEGFGMPIVEANKIGRVVVTSNCASMPEVANDSALLINPFDTESIRDGFKKVINDDSLRDLLIKNGLVNALRFDSKLIANSYLNLYKMII